MSTEKIFNEIGQSEITDRQVSSLALRPNEPSQYGIGGLSGRQLQEHFDKLAKLVISRYNELARILSSNEVLEYLKLPETITNDNLSAISDLINKLVDADGDIVVETPEDDKIKGKIKNILSSQASNIIALQESVEVLNTATGKVPSTVEMHLNEDNYKLKVTIKNHLGDTISTSEIDFPIEESVVGMTFDEETKKLHLSLRNGTSLDVDISDIFTGVVTTLTDPSTNKALAASTGALIIQRIADAVAPVQSQVDELRVRLDGLDIPLIRQSLYEHNIIFEGLGTEGIYPKAKLWLTLLNNISTSLTSDDVMACLKSNVIWVTQRATKTAVSSTSGTSVGYPVYFTIDTFNTSVKNVEIVASNNLTGTKPTISVRDGVITISAFTTNEEESASVTVTYTVPDNEVLKTFSGFVEYESAPGATDSEIIRTDILSISLMTDLVYVVYLDLDGNEMYMQLIGGDVRDSVHIIADVDEDGGGKAIIECLELPTVDISTTNFYRTPDGKIHWYDGEIWRSTENLPGWATHTDTEAIRNGGVLGVQTPGRPDEISRLYPNKLEFSTPDGTTTSYMLDRIKYQSFDVNSSKVSTHILEFPKKNGTFATLDDIGTGNAYFVGTLAEYEAQKDTIAVGTLIIITDEGDEESAILGQAILGKMILGKGA